MIPVDPPDELRRERLRRGWLRPELVEKLQQWEDVRGSGKPLPVDRNYIYRWETGRRGVSEFYAIRLEAVLGIPRHRLIDRRTRRRAGMLEAAAAQQRAGLGHQDADKPAGPAQMPSGGEFKKTLSRLASAMLPDPDRLAGSQVVDPLLLHDLQFITDEFAHRHHQARPQAIVGPLGAHLHHLLKLWRASTPTTLRPALARVIAETAAIAGWVLFRGQGDLVSAHAHLALGRQFACEAGDDKLMAQVLAATSSLYSSLDMPRVEEAASSPLALSLLRTAQRRARTGSPQLRGWLGVRIAEEQALLGEDRKARELLGRAEATLPSCSQDPDRLFVLWDETRFVGYVGKPS
jgi:transcriptional regulator with XRE-family HTH domain